MTGFTPAVRVIVIEVSSMQWISGLVMAALAAAVPLSAQTDYRNLDEGRPLETVDAAPIDHRALELRLPYRFQSAEGGGPSLHTFAPALAAGILSGVELDFSPKGTFTSTGAFALASLRAGLTTALVTETSTWPALAIELGVRAPTDDIAGSGATGSVLLLATRTFGYTRLHLNGGARIGRQSAPGLEEGDPRWRAGLGVDRTLFRHSLLLAAELRAEQVERGGTTAVVGGFGFRWQWSPVLVLDAGSAIRLSRSGAPGLGLTVGLTRAWTWANGGGR